MKIKTAKRNLILSISLILILVATLLAFFFLKKSDEIEEESLEILAYCSEVNQEDGTTHRCVGFMDEFYSPENGVECMDLLMASEELERTEIKLCAKSSVVNWEGEYSDYDFHIPVVLSMGVFQDISGKSEIQKLDVELMEEDEAQEQLAIVNSYGEDIFIKTEEIEELETRNFYVVTSKNDGDVLSKEYFAIINAQIEEYDLDEGLIIFNISFKSGDEEISLKASSENFSYSENPLEEAQLVDASNVGEILNVEDNNFQIFLSIEGEETLNEEIVKENLLKDNSGVVFLLKSIFKNG